MPEDERPICFLPKGANVSKRIVDFKKAEKPIKLIIRQFQSPGDLVMLTAAVRDLVLSYQDDFMVDVRTPCPALWENNPYLTPLQEDDPDVIKFKAAYDLIHTSNEGCHHFLHGFIQDLNEKLGIQIKPTKLKGDIHISAKEKGWFSQIYEILGKDIPYWIVDAGCKSDFTAKQWERVKYQAVVDQCPDITFVQIGQKEHNHEPLKGDNLVNLIGKTDLRQLIRVIYHSAGVITPVSLPMHLSAAIEVKDCYHRPTRPTVVLAGGREPSIWEMYTNHAFLHTCGMLPCCDNGGCWASRVYKNEIGDKDDKDWRNLCKNAVESPSGQKVPKCMDMISVDDVVIAIRRYLQDFDYSSSM